jgi:short-subunit dehydrogenase
VSRAPRRLALVTGASAGIGEAFARACAARGHDLVLTARRRERLTALAAELGGAGIHVHVLPADLSGAEGVSTLLDGLAARGLSPDLLINNAGYSRTEPFLASDWAALAGEMRVLVEAPLRLAHDLAPAMAARGYGRILNVASLAGTLPATGGDTLYGPAKGFLIQQSRGLHLQMKGTGVHVTALCPGYTLSEFHDANGTRAAVQAAYARWMWMSAEVVVEAGLAGVEANRPVVIPGTLNRLLALAARLTPPALALRAIEGHARRLDVGVAGGAGGG